MAQEYSKCRGIQGVVADTEAEIDRPLPLLRDKRQYARDTNLYIPEFQTYFIHYKFLSNILSTHAIISSCFFDSVTVRDILKSFFESLI